jgi:hypothetical protein
LTLEPKCFAKSSAFFLRMERFWGGLKAAIVAIAVSLLCAVHKSEGAWDANTFAIEGKKSGVVLKTGVAY